MDAMIVGLIVLAAVAFLGRRAWRSWKAARAATSGCASGCGCGTAASKPASWDHTPAG